MPRRKKINLVEVIDSAIGAIKDKLQGDSVKATVADLIRLLQLRQEMAPGRHQQTKIRAGWVNEWQTTQSDQ